MTEWRLRPREEDNLFGGNECPEYTSSDFFTIKLHTGGVISESPKRYDGGDFRYVDCCNVDKMSLLELYSMVAECGFVGYNEMYYKLAKADWEKCLWTLDTDADVLEMCELVQLTTPRIMYVYVVTTAHISSLPPEDKMTQEFRPSQEDFEFVQNDEEVGDENMNDEGGEVDDDEDDSEFQCRSSELSESSFFSDGSNVNSTDDEVCNQKEQKQKKGIAKGNDKDKGKAKVPDDNAEQKQRDCEQNVEYSTDSTKYAGSDEERMACNSTDEDEVSYPVFDQAEMDRPRFELGMLFPSAKVFREAVKKQAIIERRPISQCRNYGSRAKFICDGEGCQWKIYCSKMQNSDTYQIKVYQPKHTCNQTFHQKQINSRWIANHYENEIRMNPTWPLAAFHKKVVNDWNCHVSIHAIGRAKKKALQKINGQHVEQYSRLWDYAAELLKAMPDSTVLLMTENGEANERKKFKRFYTCLGPIKKGFRDGCRPLMGLDGCHLKGPFGGQLLTAVGSDANDGMYPLAWAVVEAENNDSWCWFLKQVVEDLRINNDSSWTFISDRQKGLIHALESIVPNAEHRFCVMHLYKNMWKEFKGIGVRMCLWLAARATTDYMFNKHMEGMKKLSKKCYEWLMEKPRTQWTRSSFRLTCKSDQFVNNQCEIFNSSIRKHRDLPIISMLKAIHLDVMTRIQKRRDKMLNSFALNPICPNAMRILNKAIDQSKGCHVIWSGGSKYHVTVTEGGYEMVVDLDAHKCACNKWELSGIPYYHACACIAWANKRYEPYIHSSYSKEAFLACYNHIIDPICGEEMWRETPYPKPLPPEVKVHTGRPKKKRNKTSDVPKEAATKLKRQNSFVRCSYCAQANHNARTYPAKAADKAAGCEKVVKTRTRKQHIPTAASTTDGQQNQSSTSQAKKPPPPKSQPKKTQAQKSQTQVPQRPSSHAQTSVAEGSQGGVFSKSNAAKKGPVSAQLLLEQARRDRRKGFEKHAAWKL